MQKTGELPLSPQISVSNSTINQAPINLNSNHDEAYDEASAKFENHTKEYVFPNGALHEMMSVDVMPQTVLNSKEEANNLEAQREIEYHLKEINNYKTIYRSMFNGIYYGGNIQVHVTISTASKPWPHLATRQEILEIINSHKSKALEYIHYLSYNAKKLYNARQFSRAEREIKIILDYTQQLYGLKHLETLKIQLNYGVAQCVDQNAEAGVLLIEQTLQAFKEKLRDKPDSLDVKRHMAIGYYHLAQHYLEINNFELASDYIAQSEQLRREYGASKAELDKMTFFRGKMAYERGNSAEALKLLTECHHFRRESNPLAPDLIPVIEPLVNLTEKKFAKLELLRELFNIQTSIHAEEIEVITIQLHMLNVMENYVPEHEYWAFMEEVQNKLSRIPIKESFNVGICYLSLAETQLRTLLPQDWSRTRKRNYYSTILSGYLAKAESLLRASKHRGANHFAKVEIRIEKQKEHCQLSINFFDDPAWTPFINQPRHPEDEAIVQSVAEEYLVIGSDTAKALKSLSDYSSEVNYSTIEEEGLLTEEDFAKLPQTGTINPFRLRVAQGGINSEFRDGRSLEAMRHQLINNLNDIKDIPPIEIGIYDGKVYSFDTRRLIVHQQAREENSNVEVKYRKISGDALQGRVERIFSARPWNGLVTAVRRGGKNSESEPYINPLFREQLEKTVNEVFKRYPNEREAKFHDPNGFPFTRKEAQKIHAFFVKRKKEGSESAKSILKQANKIKYSEGPRAYCLFLVNEKIKQLSAYDDRKKMLASPDGALILGKSIYGHNNEKFNKIPSSKDIFTDKMSDRQFRRHTVEGDGDCGYTAFGITREQAYQTLANNLIKVSNLLELAVKEVLLTQNFIDYLLEHDYENQGLIKAFIDSQEAAQQGHSTDIATEQLYRYAGDLSVLTIYLNYDIRDKKIDLGWSHPTILQALADVQGIELYIWQANTNRELIPHTNYPHYCPTQANGRTDLLFVNSNHFDFLEPLILGASLSNPQGTSEIQESIQKQREEATRKAYKEKLQKNQAKAKSSATQNTEKERENQHISSNTKAIK